VLESFEPSGDGPEGAADAPEEDAITEAFVSSATLFEEGEDTVIAEIEEYVEAEEYEVEEYGIEAEEAEEYAAVADAGARETEEANIFAEEQEPVEGAHEYAVQDEFAEEEAARETAEPEKHEPVDPAAKKQEEITELKKLVGGKQYDLALKKVFEILNKGYVMTPDEKQQMKIVMMTLKDKT
jgi:hypothetical protein